MPESCNCSADASARTMIASIVVFSTAERISILSKVGNANIPPEMKPNFVSSPEDMPTGFRKVSLTGGLCWMVVESPSGEYYWDCIGDLTGRWPFGRYKIGPEAVADSFMKRTYRAALVPSSFPYNGELGHIHIPLKSTSSEYQSPAPAYQRRHRAGL